MSLLLIIALAFGSVGIPWMVVAMIESGMFRRRK